MLKVTVWRYLKIGVPCVLMVMLLMRMVWMQRRTYTIETDLRTQAALEFLSQDKPDCYWPDDQLPPRYKFAHQRGQQLLAEDPLLRQWLAPSVLRLWWQDHCQDHGLLPSRVVRSNQWIWVSTVFFTSLAIRFVTGSWFWTLVVATTLMSRGSLIGSIGYVGASGYTMLYLSIFASLIAHFLRSGDRTIVAILSFWILLTPMVEKSLFFIPFALALAYLLAPLLRYQLVAPALQQLRSERRQIRAQRKAWSAVSVVGKKYELPHGLQWFRQIIGSFETAGRSYAASWRPGIAAARGGVFKPMQYPFFLWMLASRRWLKLALIHFGIFTAIVLIFLFQGAWQLHNNSAIESAWHLQAMLSLIALPVDLHYLASLGIIFICCLIKPTDGHAAFWEFSILTLVIALSAVTGALVVDWWEAQRIAGWAVHEYWARSATALLWTEPLVIAMGVAALVQIMRVIDQRLQRS